MSDEKQLALLIETLETHGIPFNGKDFQNALDKQSESAIETWIDEHLGSETLLTKEEHLLYSALQRSGETEVLASSQDLSLVRGMWDNDIENAIEQLQKSSTAIEKYTEALRTQQEAVVAVMNTIGQNHTTRTAAENVQFRGWMTENKQTKFEADELMHGLKYQTAELAGLCKNADARLRKTASEILTVDDKLLVGLQKLASDLDLGHQEEDGTVNRIKDLCARLIKYTVEGVRTRLNRIYIEAMVGMGDDPKAIGATNNAEIMALLNELESLYAEILPVAQMSTEQQYLGPALRLIASDTVHGRDRSSKVIEYVSKCLSNLTDRLQDFTIHTEEYKNYCAATMLMANAVKPELDAERPPSPKPRQASSPTRLRKQNKPMSPVRPRSTRRRSSATSFDDEVNPELQILRNLGVSIPTEPTNERDIAATLQDVLVDRASKLSSHAKSLQEVSEASIGSHLHDSQVTLQLLMESLLSETRYKSVSLLDKEMQDVMGELEKGVEKVKGDVGAINLDHLRERNIRRDELVERWAR